MSHAGHEGDVCEACIALGVEEERKRRSKIDAVTRAIIDEARACLEIVGEPWPAELARLLDELAVLEREEGIE